MQLHAIVFGGVQSGACLYALRGGSPERAVAGMMAVAMLATATTPVIPHVTFHRVEPIPFAVDLLLLVGLVALAARANRFWPLWVAAAHLLAVTVHGVRAYDQTILPIVYAKLTGWTAYLMIILLVLGTWRHLMRVRTRGFERDWSPLVWW